MTPQFPGPEEHIHHFSFKQIFPLVMVCIRAGDNPPSVLLLFSFSFFIAQLLTTPLFSRKQTSLHFCVSCCQGSIPSVLPLQRSGSPLFLEFLSCSGLLSILTTLTNLDLFSWVITLRGLVLGVVGLFFGLCCLS